jgi:peptidylprolyl isomerase
MRMRLLPALALLAAVPAVAQEAAEPPTPASIVAAAPASDWRAIDPADLLVMTLAPDRDGNPRRVVIQLMPAPFSQGWVGNIRTLAKAHWWDGTSVYRVVDNWVAQWGDGEDDKAKAKPLPEGLRVVPESEYMALLPARSAADARGPVRRALGFDSYKVDPGFFEGWPIAWAQPDEPIVLRDPQGRLIPDPPGDRAGPIHCYAHVGVARDTATTGTGAELYAVIGHAPRQLDRNIAVVGRVIEGIEHLSTLPRGKGDAGVYDDPALRVPIVSVRLGDELPEVERPRFEYLASESESFARYVQIRANRNDSFYQVPAGGIDVCNVQVPIRRVAGG